MISRPTTMIGGSFIPLRLQNRIQPNVTESRAVMLFDNPGMSPGQANLSDTERPL
jgi:hypothetical protein